MTVIPRLLAIGMRKYTTMPNDRDPAVRMIARNALRLAVAHLGAEEAASLALATLQEGQK